MLGKSLNEGGNEFLIHMFTAFLLAAMFARWPSQGGVRPGLVAAVAFVPVMLALGLAQAVSWQVMIVMWCLLVMTVEVVGMIRR